jgi:S1-C subfamily serine protease
VKRIATEILERGRVSRRWIGIAGVDLNPQLSRRYGIAADSGFLVAEIVPGSPSHAAGIRAGDVITEAGGAEVKHTKDLLFALSKVSEGDTLELDVDRRGSRFRLRVRPAEAQEPPVRFNRD